MRASVLIATRNRSALLGAVLEALARIAFPPSQWELVVVDNGSSDGSLEIAHEASAALPCATTIVSEHRPGLSGARNRAVEAARGELLFFLDDDAFPEATWLTTLESAFEDPDVMVAGGAVLPRLDAQLPPWFQDPFLPYISGWDLGGETRVLRYNEYPRGANMAMRSSVFERFGLFCRQLGRTPWNLRSCEETELCLRVERGGGKILYVPGAAVEHVVSVARLDEQWMKRRFWSQGESEAILEWRHGGLRALRHGQKRLAAIARHGLAHGGLLAECQHRAYRGYLRGALLAPFTVGRYRHDARGARARDWSQLPIP